ncbi:MAG: TetR/AcrR family transcriptional regulator [Betaproteobacteria bacterium]|nr:TetR/AcrR family transcriptional regulator [Betaproteobacteria bacterium]
MARPKSPDFAQRQQLILRSAAELFAAQGYNETLLDDIARHCGIKRSSLYHYHASKHALLHSLITWKIQDLSDKVDQAVSAVHGPRQQLQALIATLVQDYVASPHEIHILNTQSHHLDAAAQASIAVLQERLIGHARAAIVHLCPEQRWGSKSDRVLTMLLFGMVNWIPAWYKPQGGMSPEQLVDLIVNHFIGGLERIAET